MDAAKPSLWRRYVIQPLKHQLTQGMEPDKISQGLSIGITLCIIPVFGLTTPLSILAGVVFKLNHVIIQMSRSVGTPLQLGLALGFFRAGEWLFSSSSTTALSMSVMKDRFKAGPADFFREYGMILVQGFAVWLILSPFVAAALYFTLRPLIRRFSSRMKRHRSAEAAV